MKKNLTIFLDYAEALRAIQNDLEQYHPQPLLLRHLAQLILGENVLISEDKHRTGLWVWAEKKGKSRLITYGLLPGCLCSILKKNHPPIEILAKICGCVFQERAYAGSQKFGGETGIFIETGMENFKCLQCGRCCRVLDYHNELTYEDYLLWQSLGRTDIMKRVGLIRKAGEVVAYRIWIDPVTHQISDGCPWLKKDSEHNRFFCRIHDVRPGICRQYPGSRKHARMTSCNAFNLSARKTHKKTLDKDLLFF
jgi:Fe-S-cluster containining protein